MAAVYTAPQQALDALDLERRFAVFINGVPIDAIDYSGQHGVDQEIATARLTLELPGYRDLITANAAVEVQAGWNDLVGTIFSGRVPAWEGALSMRGALLTVRPVGWASLLAEPERHDLVYQGPIGLRELFLSLCARKRVPSYRADTVTAPDGATEVRLGGNARHEGGVVRIPAGRSPLSWLNAACEPYGYKVFDTPPGTVVLQRVSGLPPGAPVVTWSEGISLAEVRRGYDSSGKINYWDVRGITYEDARGAAIPIRSIAAAIPYDPEIPGGYRYKRYETSLITTQQQADIVRNRLEIDHSAPHTPVTWEGIGLPGVGPGDCVQVDSETTGAAGRYWLMEMDLSVSERDGFHGSYRGWAGAGTALAAGRDRREIALRASPVHVGDEHVPWYAQPTPVGREIGWTFTVPERATAINIVGLHHGSNSQMVGGINQDQTISRFELWRSSDTERPVSAGTLPVVNEDYGLQLDYRETSHWAPFAINLRGTEAGPVTVKLLSGRNPELPSATRWDDFEVRDVVAEIYGSNEPVLPAEGGE